MKTKKENPAIFAILIAAALLFAGCRSGEPEPASAGVETGAAVPSGTVILSAQAVADGGISTAEAIRTALTDVIKAPGELEFNARRLAVVSARARGRLERVAAVSGERVESGRVLAEIDSREYLASQAEVLQAAAREARLRGEPEEPAAKAVLLAARRKLHPLGLTDAEIDELIAAGEPRPFLQLRAAISGTIIEAPALVGAQVEAGDLLFKLADPSSLWARVHVFEKDLAAFAAGLEARLRTEAYPGREFPGRVILVGAVMDQQTRTVDGLIEVRNPDGLLRAGMYVEAEITAAISRTALIVPPSALQEFQSRPVVFVRTGPTTFVLREVATGARTDEGIEIRSGLAAGETVVTTGSFLLKSELLKSSLGD